MAKKAEEEAKKKEALRLAEEEKNKKKILNDKKLIEMREINDYYFRSISDRSLEKIKQDYCSGEPNGALQAYYVALRKVFLPLQMENRIFDDVDTGNVTIIFVGGCTYRVGATITYETPEGLLRPRFTATVRYSENYRNKIPNDNDWILIQQEHYKQ